MLSKQEILKIKKIPSLKKPKKKSFKTFINGMISGLVSRTMVAPFERVIILQQTSQSGQFSQTSSVTM
jgi:hypothetical protein